MFNPLKKKEDEAKMYVIAELAAKFVAKYINTMRLNGVPDPILAHTIVPLTQSIVGTLWMDPEALRNLQGSSPSLEEFDVNQLLPN